MSIRASSRDCATAWSARSAADASRRSPACRSQPHTFYMGVASGGVWKTTDAGATWLPITDGKIPVGSIGVDRRRASRIRTSSTSAQARTTSAATSRPAAASTSRPTAADVELRRAATMPARSARCASIRRIPNIVCVAAIGERVQAERPSAASIRTTRRRRRRGRRCCSSPTAPAPSDIEMQPGNPDVRLRVDVARPAQAVDDHQRRARGRLLQEHRRRRALGRRSPTACPTELVGKAQHRRHRGESESRLRARRSQARRRPLSLRRCRRRRGRW